MIASLLAGSVMASTATAGETPAAAFAEIGVDMAGDAVVVIGRVVGIEKGAYDARMTIDRVGASGRISTSQAGTFDIAEPGDKAEVARTSLSYGSRDRIQVKIEVLHAGKIISQANFAAGD